MKPRIDVGGRQGRDERDEAAKTGWPAGLLQDDDRGLSRWLASRPDARQRAREVANLIQGNSSASKPGAHMPSEHEENRDLMNDSPLLAGLGVIVWLCVAALVFTAWVMFG